MAGAGIDPAQQLGIGLGAVDRVTRLHWTPIKAGEAVADRPWFAAAGWIRIGVIHKSFELGNQLQGWCIGRRGIAITNGRGVGTGLRRDGGSDLRSQQGQLRRRACEPMGWGDRAVRRHRSGQDWAQHGFRAGLWNQGRWPGLQGDRIHSNGRGGGCWRRARWLQYPGKLVGYVGDKQGETRIKKGANCNRGCGHLTGEPEGVQRKNTKTHIDQ